MLSLPEPSSWKGIHTLLEKIDNRLFTCSEAFIRQQVRKPLVALFTSQTPCILLTSPQFDWFNIYSVYSSNQQLSEACNKLWATMELVHVTGNDVWKKQYKPIGELFDGKFLLGTLIPNLYYSAISAMVSILSIYGCVPVRVNKQPVYLVRSSSGWVVSERQKYMRENFGFGAKSWHDQILKTYKGLSNKGIMLPSIDIESVFDLKSLRNSMQYEILGDLRMWRVYKNKKTYYKFVPKVIDLVESSIKSLRRIATITTDCDRRFDNLVANYQSRSKS